MLLSGSPPFYDDENEDLFEKIKKCKYDFDYENWDNISEEAKDLVKRILVLEPSKRLTCEEMLKHPWI